MALGWQRVDVSEDGFTLMAVEWKRVDLNVKGFTLIEVVIALTIFSIGILSIIGMLIVGAKGIAGGSKSLIAVQAAKAQMELLRGSTVPDAVNEVCSILSTPVIQCLWSVKKGNPAEGLSTIEVTSTWYEGERKRELILTMLKFNGSD